MTKSLERRVAEFIRLHEIFAGAGRILVAVSGGADSIALLRVLKTLQEERLVQGEFVCLHANHRLRGLESEADERFVVEQAGRLGVPVVTAAMDVRGYAQTHKLSIETAARQLRLSQFSRVAREQGCTWVATGHQKDDNVETVIHRLWRGTGFRGLAGIRPVRQVGDDLQLARPLLCVTRDEIMGYLRERCLPWREDHTNVDLAYTRNFIRRRLLPLLKQDSRGSLVEDLSELALSAGVLYDRIHREATHEWSTDVRPDGRAIRIDASRLASLPQPVAVELIRLALVGVGSGERDLTESHYERVLRLVERRANGKQLSLPGGFLAKYVSDAIILTPGADSDQPGEGVAPCTLTVPGRTPYAACEIDARIMNRDEVDMTRLSRDKSPFCEYIDWDQVRPPIQVRPRRRGDRFQPLGQSVMKKLGKFLTTTKLPRDLRDQTIVFADRERILWVCPVRIAESVKVREATRQVLSLAVRHT